nr:UvrD-helicase domain-containing protein [Helicobacter sp. CLO-3]
MDLQKLDSGKSDSKTPDFKTLDSSEPDSKTLDSKAPDSKAAAFIGFLENEGFSRDFIYQNAPRIYREFFQSHARIMTIDAFFNSILKKFCWFVGLSADYQMSEANAKINDALIEEFLQNLCKSDANAFDSTTRTNTRTSSQTPPNKNALQEISDFCEKFSFDGFDGFMDFVRRCFDDKIHFSKAFFDKYKMLDSSAANALESLESACLQILQELKNMLIQGALEKDPPSPSALKALSASNMDELLSLTFTWLENPAEYKYFRKILRQDSALQSAFEAKTQELKDALRAYFDQTERAIFAYIAKVLYAYKTAKDRIISATQTLSFNDCTLKTYELLAQDAPYSENPDEDFGATHSTDFGADSARARKDIDEGIGIDPLFFYFRMDDKITHILIDEFQDTNPMQYKILEPLIEEIYAGYGARVLGDSADAQTLANRSFFIVGDSKQSIYGFRDSDSGFFERITNSASSVDSGAKSSLARGVDSGVDFGVNAGPDFGLDSSAARDVKTAESTNRIITQNLPYNYRSFSAVVDFVNLVFGGIFSNYIAQKIPQEASAQDSNTQSAKIGGFACVQTCADLSSAPNAQSKRQALLNCAMDNLAILLDSGIKEEDIAILCFTNADILSVGEEIRARFPSVKLTQESKNLLGKQSVKILLSALKATSALYKAMQNLKFQKTIENLPSALESKNTPSTQNAPKSALDSSTTPESASTPSAQNPSATLESTPLYLALMQDRYARFYLYELACLLGEAAFGDKSALKCVAHKLCAAIHSAHDSHDSGGSASREGIEGLDSFPYLARPSAYLLAFIQAFGIGDKSAQVLLQSSIGAGDIDEFFATLDSSTQALPNEHQSGLKILTIHGSKGLEYPYVIVLDRLSSARPSTKAPMIHYDNSGASRSFLRLPKANLSSGGDLRAKVDSLYQRANELAVQKSENEKNNVLYVACTRAKKGLIILAKDEKSEFEAIKNQVYLQGEFGADSSFEADSVVNSHAQNLAQTKAKSKIESKTQRTDMAESSPDSQNSAPDDSQAESNIGFGLYSADIIYKRGGYDFGALHRLLSEPSCALETFTKAMKENRAQDSSQNQKSKNEESKNADSKKLDSTTSADLADLSHSKDLVDSKELADFKDSQDFADSQDSANSTESAPIILRQQNFGAQSNFMRQESSSEDEIFVPNIASIRFGEALHLGLEYRLGFGVSGEALRSIVQNHFALDSSTLDKIEARIDNLMRDNRIKMLLHQAQKVAVEVPLLEDSTLKRLDFLAWCDEDLAQDLDASAPNIAESQESKKWESKKAESKNTKSTESKNTQSIAKSLIVIDYKSGLKRQNHIAQVQEYISALERKQAAQSIKGYIIYVRDNIEWVRV